MNSAPHPHPSPPPEKGREPEAVEKTASPAWDAEHLADPHHEPDKATRVREMFAAIAPSYDLNNRVHSLGRDQAWRKTAVNLSGLQMYEQVVDVACGTGDLTFQFVDEMNRLTQGTFPPVIGIDFTHEMLPIARRKAQQNYAQAAAPEDADDSVMFLQGDAMNLPLPDACCDVLSIAFGIRNVTDPAIALREFFRVLKPGGRLIILEFTVPRNPLMRWGNNFYCGWLMPRTASWIAGDKSGAYRYLPRSVATFAGRDEMHQMVSDAGFADPTSKSLTFGIAACYRAVKP